MNSLFFRLLILHGVLIFGLVTVGLFLHRDYSSYQNDLTRSDHMGKILYGVVAAHLTPAPVVSPPNGLKISVRKIGDFLDDGMRVEQTIPLPTTRIGSDWPVAIRVRSEKSAVPPETLIALGRVSYAEEFFVNLAGALVAHGQSARVVAHLDQSIAVAFDAKEIWKPRRTPKTSLLFAIALAGIFLTIWIVSIKYVSGKIRASAVSLLRTNIDKKTETVEKISEFIELEEAINQIIAANFERDAERVSLLAAISHDLRTPITRVRLQAEFVQDTEARSNMLKALDEIDVMVDESMRFLKREDQREELQIIDIVSLVQSVCDDMTDLGKDVIYRNVLSPQMNNVDASNAETGSTRVWINARPFALRRAISNIAGNAVRYGGKAEVRLRIDQEQVVILIDDPGQGIPKEHWESALLPFFRIEKSRSKGTGGTGLGLATAKSVIDAVNGNLEFSFTEDGWFRVSVLLSLAL